MGTGAASTTPQGDPAALGDAAWIACRRSAAGTAGSCCSPGSSRSSSSSTRRPVRGRPWPVRLCRREDYVRFGELFPGPSEPGGCDGRAAARGARDGREAAAAQGARLEGAPGRRVRAGRRGSRGSCWPASSSLDACGYAEPQAARPRPGDANSPPPSLVEVLRAGWEGVVPLLHPTAAQTATALSSPKNAR